MKKNIIYSTLAALLITACSNEELVPMVDQPAEGDEITITVGVPAGDGSSRVSYADEATANLTWEAGDKLVVAGYKADDTYVGQSDFAIQSDVPEKCTKADFTGKLPVGAGITQYEVYYGATKLTVAGKKRGEASIDYSGQSQTAAASTAHLKDYLFLQTQSPIAASVFPTSKLKLGMKNAIMKFDIESMKSGIGTLKSITWENKNASTTPSVTLSVTDNKWTGAGTAYVCFDPAAMKLDAGGDFKVMLNGSFAYELSAKSANGKVYNPGTRYKVNITAGTSTVAGALSTWNLIQSNNEIWVKTTTDAKPGDLGSTNYKSAVHEPDSKLWSYKREDGKDIISMEQNLFNSYQEIKEVYLPKTVTTLEESLFLNCKALEKVELPEGLQTIGAYTFQGCATLTAITIPASVTTLGARAFDRCSALKSVNLPEGLLTIGEFAFYSCTSLKAITIPSTITTWGTDAFNSCTELTTVTLKEGLQTIGADAFVYCKKIASLTIPSSVTTIGEYAFNHCEALETIVVPENVTILNDGIFRDCSVLATVTLPTNLKEIKSNSFQDCVKLTSINIPATVEKIGSDAFSACLILRSITLPDKLKEIGTQAFYYCKDLTEITIPASVTTLGAGAFNRCDAMTKVTVKTPYSEALKSVSKQDAAGKEVQVSGFNPNAFAGLQSNQVDLLLEPSWLTAPADMKPAGKSWMGNKAWKSILDLEGNLLQGGQLPDFGESEGGF